MFLEKTIAYCSYFLSLKNIDYRTALVPSKLEFFSSYSTIIITIISCLRLCKIQCKLHWRTLSTNLTRSVVCRPVGVLFVCINKNTT